MWPTTGNKGVVRSGVNERDWRTLTQGRSEATREWADKWMAESFRLADERDEMRSRGQHEVNFQFQQRLTDIKLWIEQLTIKSEEISKQIDTLDIYIQRIQNAINSIPPIIQKDKIILQYREFRIGVDLVDDEPHKELMNEICTLEYNENLLNNLLRNCTEKVRLLRKYNYSLEKELEDKKEALEVDKYALRLNAHSSQVSRQKSSSIQPNSHVGSETEWEELSWNRKKLIEDLLRQCDNLAVQVESSLRTVCEELQAVVCQTNGAFEKRLISLGQSKAQLETEHGQICINIREMENVIDKMKKSLTEKESSIALTETRIAVRNHRPNMELVKDGVQHQLQIERWDLEESIRLMENQLINSNNALRTLLASQLNLEQEINVKVQSIAIDETQVLPLRKTINIHQH